MDKIEVVNLGEQANSVEEDPYLALNRKVGMISEVLKKVNEKEYLYFISNYQKFEMDDPDLQMYVDEEFEALFGAAAK